MTADQDSTRIVALEELGHRFDRAFAAQVKAPRRRLRLAMALTGVAAMAASGAALLMQAPPDTASAYLGRAAQAAAEAGEPWRLGPGQYWYVSSRIVNTGAAARCYGPVKQDLPRGGFRIRGDCGTMTLEEWEAIDDSGRFRLVAPAGPDGEPTVDDHLADPHPRGSERAYVDVPGLDITYRELVGMTGAELAERVRGRAAREADRGHGASATGNLFLYVGNLLAAEALSPGQRATLYKMIAREPGIRSLGEVADPEGRRGVAVGHGEEGRETVIIFDPDTSRVLAAGTGLAGRTPPRGGAGQYVVWLGSGVVGSTSETAGGRRSR